MNSKPWSRRLRRFLWIDEAVSALEYAILVGIIAVGAAAALTAFQDNIEDGLEAIGAQVAATDPGAVDTTQAD